MKKLNLFILLALFLFTPLSNFNGVKLFRSPGRFYSNGALMEIIPVFYRSIIRNDLYLNPIIYFVNKDNYDFNGNDYVIKFYLEFDDVYTTISTLKKYANLDNETENKLISFLKDFKKHIYRNDFAFRILLNNDETKAYIIKSYSNFERISIDYKEPNEIDLFYMIQDSLKILLNFKYYIKEKYNLDICYNLTYSDGVYYENLLGLLDPQKTFIDVFSKKYNIEYDFKKIILKNSGAVNLTMKKGDYEFEIIAYYSVKDNYYVVQDIYTTLYNKGKVINYSYRTSDNVYEFFIDKEIKIKKGYQIFWGENVPIFLNPLY